MNLKDARAEAQEKANNEKVPFVVSENKKQVKNGDEDHYFAKKATDLGVDEISIEHFTPKTEAEMDKELEDALQEKLTKALEHEKKILSDQEAEREELAKAENEKRESNKAKEAIVKEETMMEEAVRLEEEVEEEKEAPIEKNFVRDLDASDIGKDFIVKGKKAMYHSLFGNFIFEGSEEVEHVAGITPCSKDSDGKGTGDE